MKNTKKPTLGALPTGSNIMRQAAKDSSAYSLAEIAFSSSTIPLVDKLEAFPRFSTKRALARFLVKERIYQQILNINGIIVECGVLHGSGLFTWAQLSNIFEPTNYNRKIIGFDTFEGFPTIDGRDNTAGQNNKPGDLRGSTVAEISISLEKYNHERHLSHIDNVTLIEGDFNVTAERFLNDNQHIIVSLLYLDFDLYEPTKRALELFLPRMPKGAILAFDELNCDSFPGETTALNEVIGISRYELKRFPFDPWISYIVL